MRPTCKTEKQCSPAALARARSDATFRHKYLTAVAPGVARALAAIGVIPDANSTVVGGSGGVAKVVTRKLIL